MQNSKNTIERGPSGCCVCQQNISTILRGPWKERETER